MIPDYPGDMAAQTKMPAIVRCGVWANEKAQQLAALARAWQGLFRVLVILCPMSGPWYGQV